MIVITTLRWLKEKFLNSPAHYRSLMPREKPGRTLCALVGAMTLTAATACRFQSVLDISIESSSHKHSHQQTHDAPMTDVSNPQDESAAPAPQDQPSNYNSPQYAPEQYTAPNDVGQIVTQPSVVYTNPVEPVYVNSLPFFGFGISFGHYNHGFFPRVFPGRGWCAGPIFRYGPSYRPICPPAPRGFRSPVHFNAPTHHRR